MTEKRFKAVKNGVKDIKTGRVLNGWVDVALKLNEIYGENQELNHFLKKEIDSKIEYKKRVKEILQEYFNRYTEMAMELRNDKYGNGMCHDVTEVIYEIADKLWIDLDLMGFKND